MQIVTIILIITELLRLNVFHLSDTNIGEVKNIKLQFTISPPTPSPTGEGKQVTFTCSVSTEDQQKTQKAKVTYSPSPSGRGKPEVRPNCSLRFVTEPLLLLTHQFIDALLNSFIVYTKLLTAFGIVAICTFDYLSSLSLNVTC